MSTEANETTLLPAPADTYLWPVGLDGHLGDSSTVVAFVVDLDHQIVDVVTNTGDKLHTPQGQPGALVIGDRVSFGGYECSWGEFVKARPAARKQMAASGGGRPATPEPAQPQ